MSARVKTATAAIALLTAGLSTPVAAVTSGGGEAPPTADPDAVTEDPTLDGPTMFILLGMTGGGTSSETKEAGSAPSRPRCPWSLSSVTIEGDSYLEQRQHRIAGVKPPVYVDVPGVGTESWMLRECPGERPVGQWVMSPEGVDIRILIDAAWAAARGSTPAPVVEISPSPDVGGIVNVGMWLAVGEPGQVNVIAELGPVWVSLTASYVGTMFEMGNGDVVRCAGIGTPFPGQVDSFEEGPCGYTYAASTSVDAPYLITVTGHWEVQLLASDGRDEPFGDIDIASTVSYDVDEVVTVGEA